MIISRPVQYTRDVAAYRAVLDALGLVPLHETDVWSVYAAGEGRVALHAVDAADPLDGGAALAFESDELDRLLTDFGPASRAFTAEDGTPGVVIDDELEIVVLAPTAGTARGTSGLRALALWVSPDVPRAASTLERLGLRREVESDSGDWVQLLADEGLAAVHDGAAPSAQLSFEYDGDVDELAARVRAAGIEAGVVDESYGRTLLVARPEGGEPIWVNERQGDLYGYTATAEPQ